MKYLKKFEDVRYMSDKDIEAGYDNFKITHFTVDKLLKDGGATGSIEIEFEDPDDDSDYKYDTKYDNWIKYNSGPKIAFDNWYPKKLNIFLKNYIEKGIKKYKLEQNAKKYNL